MDYDAGMPSAATLFYIHDPMCSWCWGFDPVRRELWQQLPPGLRVQRLLGGLAPDTDEPMPQEMRQYVQDNWRQVQARVPACRFNHDFWVRCQPRRATWPACRAVIAAREQGGENDELMTRAIQNAYYTEARNPSDNSTLIKLAGETGLAVPAFSESLAAPETQQKLLAEIESARRLNVGSYPALVLQTGDSVWRVPVDYRDSRPMLELIEQLLL